jgi:hypothetical protein
LTEHRQADPKGPPGAPGRVGIEEDNGGWFIEMDEYWDEDPKFMTDNLDLPVMIKTPEYAPNPTESDNPFYDFIKNDMNQLCDSMVSQGFPENGYRDLIDMNTFVNYLMVNEIVMNYDLGHLNSANGKRYPKSCFVYKSDTDGKISMGPLWDFDWSFAYTGIQHNYFSRFTGRLPLPLFFERLFDDPVFVVQYKERWIEKFDEIFAMTDFIETVGAKITPAAIEDAKRWCIPGGYRPEYDPDHTQQIELMKNWWENRVSWLHTELIKVEAVPKNGNFGSVTFDEDYTPSPKTFSIVALGALDNISVTLKNGDASVFEISSSDIQIQATDNGGYLASFTVLLQDGLSLGSYNDVLIISGQNQGNPFTLNVPVSFNVTKYKQELLALNEVEDKVFGDANFFLTTTGGSGNGKITFEVISGNANFDKNTGEVEITGAGDIVVIATKAEDETYQQTQSQEMTISVAKTTPSYTVPSGFTAMYGNLLSTVVLPDCWEWEDETLPVGDVGTHTFKAIYTPVDTANYVIVNGIDLEITVDEATGIPSLSKSHPLRAWMHNGSLHISGINPGETLRIYNIMGVLMYHCITFSDEIAIPLTTKGMFIIKSGDRTAKIVKS